MCALTHPVERFWWSSPLQDPSNLFDKVLHIAPPVDGIVRKGSPTILSVCEDAVVQADIPYCRRGEDPVKGTIDGTDFCLVVGRPQCCDPIRWMEIRENHNQVALADITP